MTHAETDVLNALPNDEISALSPMGLWQRINCWSPSHIRHQCYRLAKAGVISRRQVPYVSGGYRWLYWRAA